MERESCFRRLREATTWREALLAHSLIGAHSVHTWGAVSITLKPSTWEREHKSPLASVTVVKMVLWRSVSCTPPQGTSDLGSFSVGD